MKPATARNLSALLLVAAVVALPGCRSDGGFGRKDNARSFTWAFDRFTDQMKRDWETTTDSVVGLPNVVARDFRQGVDGLSSTYWLYVEGNTHGTIDRVRHTPETHAPEPDPADVDHVDYDTRGQ